jgi:hypothetical protein
MAMGSWDLSRGKISFLRLDGRILWHRESESSSGGLISSRGRRIAMIEPQWFAECGMRRRSDGCPHPKERSDGDASDGTALEGSSGCTAVRDRERDSAVEEGARAPKNVKTDALRTPREIRRCEVGVFGGEDASA